MTFTAEQLNSARKEGYSDDEIWEYLGGQDKGFAGAKQEGYSLDEVAGYFSSLPTGTSFTQEVQQLGPAFVESLGRPLESMGESFEVLGFQGVADALKGAITEPENYVSAAQRFMEPKEDEAQFLGFAWQYAPRAAVEQAGQAIGSVATRVAGGIAGAPLGPAGVATGAFVGPAIFEAAQIIGPVAKERAKNNGREVPTNEDILAATVTAAGSGALNAIGAKYLPGGEKATGKFFKRVASSFVGEAATEAPQSIVEQVGTTAGTEAGLNVNLKQAIGEGLIGGVTGAGLTGITAPFTKGAEEQVIRTPEQAEEIDIEAKANEEAVSLLGAPADQAKNAQISKVKELEAVIANNEMLEQAFEPNTPEAQRLKMENKVAREEIEKAKVELEKSVGLTPVENTKQVQSRIQQAKVELTGLEPTSRKAKALEAQIAQDEAKVKALSEPIAAAEAEQARLAREIAAPAKREAKLPTMPTIEEQTAEATYGGEPGVFDVFGAVTRKPAKLPKEVTRPTIPSIAEQEAGMVYGGETGVYDVFGGVRRKPAPIEPVAEAPTPITPAPAAEAAPAPVTLPVKEAIISVDKTESFNQDLEQKKDFNPPATPSLQDARSVPDKVAKKGNTLSISGGSQEAVILNNEKSKKKFDEIGYERQDIVLPDDINEKVSERYGQSISNIKSIYSPTWLGAHFHGGIAVSKNVKGTQRGRVVAHELGHASHSLLGDQINKDQEVLSELGKIEQLLYPGLREKIQSSSNPDTRFFNYLLSADELIAEFNVERITNPEQAAQVAPKLTSLLESVEKDKRLVADRKAFPVILGAIRETKERLKVKGLEPREVKDETTDVFARKYRQWSYQAKYTISRAKAGELDWAKMGLEQLKTIYKATKDFVKRTAELSESPELMDYFNELYPEEAPTIAPTSVTTPAAAEAVTPTPAAPTPTAPAVGNRIKLGKSPQTYTIEEVIPQTEAEKELGEQYYSVRNEKTGEVQTVEAKDLKPVKAKGVRKMAARTRNEEYMRLAQEPEANREQLQRMVDEAARRAGIPTIGFNINDSEQQFTEQILNGEKTIETRDSENNALANLVGQRVAIVRTGKGKARVVGYVTIGEPIRYTTKLQFDADYNKHLVGGGKYGFKGFKVGYPMLDVQKINEYDAPPATGVIKTRPIQLPVKRDNAGNVIPLEERFQPTSPDIRREAATRVKDESLVVPEADRYTFEQAEAEARKLFGGMPEGFIIVNDSVDPEYEFKAGYEPDSGDIILNLAYIRKGESVRNLIAHELGHYAAGDPEIRAKLQEFLDALPPVTRSRIERFVERFYNEDTGEMRLEEKQVRAFVQMLKKSENRNVFQKILDAIKKWLNDKLGTNFQPTDMDAAAILSGAINRYKSGEKIAREDGEMREAKVTRSEDVKKDIAIAEQIQSVVNDTISKMPQEQARDYNAFVNEGKSEAQIAEENNTSVSQVRTNIVRGKKAVGDAIKKAKIDTKAKPENVVLEWTTGAVKKYFTKEGDLPFGTFQNWVRRNAKLAREAEEARQATQDFYEGLRKLYKINKIKFILDGLSSIPPEDVARFNDALAGEIPISDMPTEIQEPLTRMRQHIDAMSSELIATGQLPEDLEVKVLNNFEVYLTRSYKIFSDPKWINKIPQEKLTAARNFLYQQQSKTDPSFTIKDADRKLEQMLNDWAGEKDMEGKRGGRLGAKDLSVMMTRSEVPKQLRDVMGENTNIIFNYANTIAKISRFVADQQFLDAVKKEGAGKFLFTKDAAPKGFNTLIAPEESRTMAPLSGLRTTPEIAKAFEEFGKAYDAKANPVLYAFGWLNAVGKANLTVGSLFTQARNIVGQPFFFLANGHGDLRAINREVERIMKSKGLSKDKARNELVKMAAGEGLVNENAYAGELKEAFEQIGLKTFEDMDADEFSRQFVLLRLFKKGTQGAQKVYQKTDELGKLIGWLNETNRIQKMNPGMSREDAMSIASERTRNTYPTYSQGSEALRLFRRQPFFGPFATFFYETFRTTYWNVVYAFQDINSGTDAGKQEGIKRLAGTMAQIAIGAYLVNAISAMVSGIGDQEEEDVRRMLPPWAANASLVWFPKTKDGVYDFINFSSLNPYNALSDPFVTMMSGFSRGEDPTDIFINAAGTFLSPFTSEQPVTAATIDALRNVTERGTKVYNEEDDLGTKTSKILLHIFGKAFTPGTIDRLRKRIIPAIYGETVGTRAPAPLKEISAEFTGVRFENLDMRQAFQNKAWEFSKAQNDSERIFRDVATRRRRVTEEEQVEAYRRAEESRFENWQEMYRNYMAVRRAGASKEEAVRLMTDIKISKREASYIARGKYVPYEVSDEVRRRSKLNGNVVPLQEIKAIAKEMPRVLEDVQ